MRTSTVNQLASILVYLDTAAWIGFGIAAGLGVMPDLPEGSIRWQMAALAAAAGGALLSICFSSPGTTPRLFSLLLGLLALISLLSITDQGGLLDWIVFVLNLAALVLLIIIHRQHAGQKSGYPAVD